MGQSENLELGSAFPARYWWDFDPPWYISEIIVNWLDLEVDQLAEQKMPILQRMAGFRHREVHDYVHAFVLDRMTQVAIEMYGKPK
jgi:hypothetical protein